MEISDLDFEHVKVDGLKLHCARAGNGKLVVLLHGFPECWYSWRHQIASLSRKFKVVAPDMRGYNLSDKPVGVSSYKMEYLISDVEKLLDHFGAKKAHIVGHDWGGAVAWSFATYKPARTDKLIIMNCPHPAQLARHLFSNPRQIKRSWYMFFFQLPKIPEAVFSAFDYYAIRRVFRDWPLNKEAFSDKDIKILVQASARPGALTGGINYYRAALRDPSMFRLARAARKGEIPKVSVPTLVIWAEEDIALGKELTYRLGEFIDAEFKIRYIPRCSHWVQQEQAVLVSDMVMEFLD